ncbi:MAG: nucleotidyltransferase family protein [Bdellovibrionales bacterium]
MKQPSSIPKEVFNLLLKIKRMFPVEQILLFGSRARGDFKERSDIDIAISAPACNSRQWLEIEELLLYNSVSLLNIDLVRFDQITDPTFKERIESESISI